MKSPQTNHYVFDANHSSTGGYVNASDPCTIHEVYTDGCCKFSYILDNGNTRTAYGKIEWFKTEETHSCSGYDISLTNSSSNGKFYDSNIAQITIIPKIDGKNASESEINQITLKIKAPDGSVKTNNMGKSTTYKFYIGDGVKNAGTYTFWAEVDTKYGSYKGSANNGSTSLTLSTISLTNGTFDGDVTYKRIQFEEIDRYLTADSDGNVVSYERQNNNSSNQSQVWKLIKNSDGTYIIQSVENNNVLDVTKGVYAQGVNVITYNSQGSDNQKWYLSKNSDGDWFIRAAMSNSAVLDVEGGATANGTNVALWTYHGGTPQKVSFKYPYQITYNANGGSGAPANQSKDYNEGVTLSSTKPTKSGYTFLGWATSSSATSANYTPGSSYNANADLNLYAVWKPAGSIYTGTSYSTTIGFANQEYYYTFTPSSCGEYTFESTGSLDSRVYVYDSSWTQLGYNDDDGTDYNFKLKINLTSGTKYYIKVRAYSSKVGSTSFNVTKSNGTVGHTYTSVVTKAATCTASGIRKYTCSRCSYSYTTTIAATGHTWNAASCTAPKTCTVCKATSGSALGHIFDNACDTSCNDCGKTRPASHSYKSATCTTPKTCTICGVTSGSKLGHTYTNACDNTCNRCSYTRTAAHTYKTVTTKATLTANGSSKTVCTACGNLKSTKTISSPKTFTLSATSYTYNGNVKKPTVTVKDSAGKTLVNGTDYTVTYAEGRKNVGTYNVKVTMKGNYTGTKTLSFKIKPINISTCTVKLSATSLTYNAKTRTPTVTVTNSYGTKLTKDKHYTVTYDTGRRNVGTYNVKVTMKGNYTGTKTLSFKIKPMDISKCTVKLSATSLTYNGNTRTPTITVTNANGVKLTKDTHYTVTYASGRKNVGTYNVKVTMKGNYTGTKTLSFKIKPIDISTCTVKLSATSLIYNGEIRTPEVSVINSYGTTLNEKNYTVTYSSGRKNVGTYKVIVTMKGNYTGTKTLTFKILPPKTTISKLTAGAKKITVNLTKKTTQVTGYQIQYSTSKDFTNAKTKTLTSSSTVKTTLSGLSSAKTYYVRVRTYKTVNDVKYYSGWSAYRYVKTK
ncbi:MAG: RICIN domain-containing protein [Clostridia bacterium]|nr:RICIN domain-containing protein [Clostridia bacterium]